VSNDSFLNKYEPSVSHTWHYSIAGLMWMGVGIMLTVYAAQWLAAVDKELIWFIIVPSFIGIIAAFLIYYFGFSKLVEKNIKRIEKKSEKFCVFGFISWQSYIIIAIMITMGIFLKRSPIPKPYLAPLYLGLGGGLGFSSIGYFVKIYKKKKYQTQLEELEKEEI